MAPQLASVSSVETVHAKPKPSMPATSTPIRNRRMSTFSPKKMSTNTSKEHTSKNSVPTENSLACDVCHIIGTNADLVR